LSIGSTDLSKIAFDAASKIFPGGVNSPVRAFTSVESYPFFVEKGEGPYLFDIDGNRYVDYICSWGPIVLGHATNVVNQAIIKQLMKGSTFGACTTHEFELGLMIQKFFPSMEKMRFVNSGTEAGMAVLRLARAYTKREKIIKFKGCYHGHADSLLVQAGSGILTLSLPDSPGVLLSSAESTLIAKFNDINSVKVLLESYADQIAAVIIEPIVGNSGFIEPNDGFLEELRALTKKYGVLLIFDEVMTGFRVSLGGAQQLYNITPDITMLGKVIGGGLPIGAYGGRKEIMSLIAPEGLVYQAGTLSGNPLAMVAGLATIKEWSKESFFQRTSDITNFLINEMKKIFKSKGIPFIASSRGTMFGFFFSDIPVINYDDAIKCDKKRFVHFFKFMLNQGIFFAPSPFEAGFISLAHEGEALEETLLALHKYS
jgi:glutamate-1-semialdehyde 2,1-aminomutase